MQSFTTAQPSFQFNQSPIFVTARPGGGIAPYFKTPSKTIKSLKTLQNESIKRPRNSFQQRQREQEERENQQLQEEYIEINREIALLECELMPLRERCVQLRMSIMSFHSLYFGHQCDDIIEPPNFSSAFIELQNERDDLNEQLSEVQQHFSQQSIQTIEYEIDQGNNFCALLSASNAELKHQTDETCQKIEQFRQSQFYHSIQNQRKQISELTQSYQDAKHKHSALKAEHFQLTDPVLQKEEKNVYEADSVIKLNRKLNKIRRKHFELCDQLIQLRQKQMEEIEMINIALKTQKSLAAIPNIQKNSVIQPFQSMGHIPPLQETSYFEKIPTMKPTSSTSKIPTLQEDDDIYSVTPNSKKVENSLIVPSILLKDL